MSAASEIPARDAPLIRPPHRGGVQRAPSMPDTFAGLIDANPDGRRQTLAEAFDETGVLGRRAVVSAVQQTEMAIARARSQPESARPATEASPPTMLASPSAHETARVAFSRAPLVKPQLAPPAGRVTGARVIAPPADADNAAQMLLPRLLDFASNDTPTHVRTTTAMPRPQPSAGRNALLVAIQAVDFGLTVFARVGRMDASSRLRLRQSMATLLAQHGFAHADIVLDGDFNIQRREG